MTGSIGNTINLEGKIAVVTGGAQGIGYAVAHRFIQSGAKVCLWDVNEVQLKSAKSKLEAISPVENTVHTCKVDVRDYEQAETAVKECESILGGRIEILVNNAGIAGVSAPLWEMPVVEWQKVIDIDLTGVFHCCRAVLPSMRASQYGRVVNIASVAGKEGNPLACAYSSAKSWSYWSYKVSCQRVFRYGYSCQCSNACCN